MKWSQADLIAAIVGNDNPSVLKRRDAAHVALMSDCMLRVSELSAPEIGDLSTRY